MKKIYLKLLGIIISGLLFLVACQKDKLEDNLTNVKLKKAYISEYKLSYIGQSQWVGYFNGTQILFSGPTQDQLTDGLLHRYELISAYDGSMIDQVTQVAPIIWKITKFLAGVGELKLTRVDWVVIGTTTTVTPNWNTGDVKVITTADWEKRVSYYQSGSDLGGTSAFSFTISLMEVDNWPEIYSVINPNPPVTPSPTPSPTPPRNPKYPPV